MPKKHGQTSWRRKTGKNSEEDISTRSFIRLLLEKATSPAEQKMQYATLIIYKTGIANALS